MRYMFVLAWAHMEVGKTERGMEGEDEDISGR